MNIKLKLNKLYYYKKAQLNGMIQLEINKLKIKYIKQ